MCKFLQEVVNLPSCDAVLVVQILSEFRDIAASLAAIEIASIEINYGEVFTPPFPCNYHRSPCRRSWIKGFHVAESKIDLPRPPSSHFLENVIEQSCPFITLADSN